MFTRRDFLKLSLGTAAALLGTRFQVNSALAGPEAADLILTNGRVATLDERGLYRSVCS